MGMEAGGYGGLIGRRPRVESGSYRSLSGSRVGEGV
jgi:hypothetical protein